ncbi:phage portal protein [Selenomonas ruminantium]|uniref:phage portal protein n=1 Tax=Selenomonas ruminantium TaxID=971 RepID=UPI0005A55399|nr:phage portal protein [Selenomonas ruminantium]
MVFNYLSNMVKSKFNQWRYNHIRNGVFTDNQPIFTSFGDNIYMSDLINNCIDRIATEFSKIDIKSVVETDDERVAIQKDDITRLFRFQPNPLQSTKDFLASCEWLRRKTCHCFIFPQWEEVKDSRGNTTRRYTAFYPLNPSSVKMGQDEFGNWLVEFTWKDGTSDTMPLNEVIHLKWRRGTNLIACGGNDQGNVDDRDTLKSLDILHKVMEGLPIAIEAGLKLSGVYTAKTIIDADKLKAKRDKLEEHIMTSKAGILAIDLAGDFHPMSQRSVVIPESIMTFLKKVIRERYGVSEAIVSGQYNDDDHAAFYETCIEDAIVEFEQAFSQVLFTPREQDIGHRVKCYYNKVEYYSTANKISLAQIARETGIMTLNQMADMFGLPPFIGGERRLQSLNFVNLDHVDKYQLKNSQKGESDNGKE